jgi:hypothetical protein
LNVFDRAGTGKLTRSLNWKLFNTVDLAGFSRFSIQISGELFLCEIIIGRFLHRSKWCMCWLCRWCADVLVCW